MYLTSVRQRAETIPAPNKELSILIYGTPFCVIIKHIDIIYLFKTLYVYI